MTRQTKEYFERLLNKKLEDFTPKELEQIESLEREKLPLKGEKKLKAERNVWSKVEMR